MAEIDAGQPTVDELARLLGGELAVTEGQHSPDHQLEAVSALFGTRVLDLTTERAELAGWTLAQLGADVVKVEPVAGAWARQIPPFSVRDGSRESLYWDYVGLGKRSIGLDVSDPALRSTFLQLCATADVIIESFEPGYMDGMDLGYQELASRNERLVYVAVTPYGQTGPERLSPASDLTIEAACGLLSLQGDGDRPPVAVGYPQASFHAGTQAAADALIALCEREISGKGQFVDVSMQATMVSTLLTATGMYTLSGADAQAASSRRALPPLQRTPGVDMPTIFDCADGYVTAAFALGDLGGQSLERVVRWMDSESAINSEVGKRNYSAWVPDLLRGTLSPELMSQVVESVIGFFLTKTKHQLMERAVAERLLLAPSYSVADVAADRQLSARNVLEELDGRTRATRFARLSVTPLRVTPAPRAIGRHEPESELWRTPQAAARPAKSGVTRKSSLAGLRVADFTWAAVGPMITKTLADHGATVIKIETATRPDVTRLLPPFADGKSGINRSQFFGTFNTSKLSVALDLSTAGARDAAMRLVEWSDVVVENFSPGVMDRLGFGYEVLRETKPRLVMLSTSMRGADGPEANYAGFGSQGIALTGLHYITGWPDRPPCGPWGAYTDLTTPRLGVATLVAALLHARRTGVGQHIEVSQVEATLPFIGPLLTNCTLNGVVAQRCGNESDRACPHGVYQVAGDERYIALAVESAAQWEAVLAVAADSGLTELSIPAPYSLQDRLDRQPQIDSRLRDWMRHQDGWSLAAGLRDNGVPASMVLRPSDLFEDRQLTHRDFFQMIEHQEMGPVFYDGFPSSFSATPPQLTRPAPLLGEHTDYVLETILGFDGVEVEKLRSAGALR